MPLPPLQVYWSTLGSLTYFLKHNSKKIPTLPRGRVDYNQDYTEFWKKNVVHPIDTHRGWINVAKKCAENGYILMKDPKWQDIANFWA